MSQPFDSREVFRLTSQALDGVATDEELLRLEQLLAESPAVRDCYYQAIDLHAELAWTLGEQRTGPELGDESASERKGETATPVDSFIALPPTRPFAPSSKLGFLAPITRRVPGGEVTVGGLIVFVIAVAFWGLAQAIMHPNLGGHDLAHDLSPLAPDKGRGAGGEGHAVATITDTADVEWSPNPSSLIPHPSAITPGEPLSITSGLVELELAQGTKLLIEGPAEWTIDGNNHATLKRGKLVARVPHGAIGFTLDTPTAQIVDLGTEFSVEVQESRETDVHVLRGRVEATTKVDGKPVSVGSREIIEAGNSRRVSAQGLWLAADSTTPTTKLVQSLPTEQSADVQSPAIGLIAADGFSAADGALHGHHGGEGQWAGAWDGVGFAASGGAAVTEPHKHNGQTSWATRPLEATKPGETVFASARFRATDAAPQYASWVRLFHEIGQEPTSNVFTFGLANGRYCVALGLEGEGLQTDFGQCSGDFHRLVAKCEFNVEGAKDRITVWVDPTSEERAAEVKSLMRELPFDKVAFVALRGNLHVTASIDDLRIGLNWAAVVPPVEPEPTPAEP